MFDVYRVGDVVVFDVTIPAQSKCFNAIQMLSIAFCDCLSGPRHRIKILESNESDTLYDLT